MHVSRYFGDTAEWAGRGGEATVPDLGTQQIPAGLLHVAECVHGAAWRAEKHSDKNVRYIFAIK